MVISLSRDPTIPAAWGRQLVWWRWTVVYDYELRLQPSFLGYFR